MMKRITWFAGGVVAGVAGAGLAKRKVKSVAVEYSPTMVARKATDRAKEAFQEGRMAMRSKEQELKAQRDGRHGTLADELADGDQVIVDGRPVQPGQVIVLRQVRDADEARGARRRRA